MKKHSFLRHSPLAFLVVPAAFALLTVLLLGVGVRVLTAPYQPLITWFFSSTEDTQPRDLLQGAADTLQNGTAASASTADAPQTIPLSSITYPAEGDKYAEISISGTTVSAPVYYGDSNSLLNQGVGTYKDANGVGIPGQGKTILLAGHNNTFFNDLQHVAVGAVVTIRTAYGTYTYEVTDTEVKDYQDASAYDFTRTDENLILYTCYPFDALGFTPNRFFVYAKYVSGPTLDANS